ncbi:MAG: NAD-dependent epimerase/dehydratase family protein [Bacteroidales bacterium]|nr:NAD-dependent epimerase/dehydratase family protein [Bacteroidales bacterium]
MNVLVVGGSGFIGTRLCRRLSEKGSDFRIIDKSRSVSFPEKTVMADVREIEALRNAVNPNAVIINLAAEHRDDVRPLSLYDEVNVQGARNLCAVAREKSVNTIVFTSSVAVYGFAPEGTDETGEFAPFNEYGRTKAEAEGVYRAWQEEAPQERALVIVRPTVVFGERNRGNVYNLLRQIASGRFIMVGDGRNYKSMAYVENVAAFLEHAVMSKPGIHIYNYIDKPDIDMNSLVSLVRKTIGKGSGNFFRLPYWAGYSAAKILDAIAFLTGKNFPISSIRVKKFCSTTSFSSSTVSSSGFVAPFSLDEGLKNTIQYEFIEDNSDKSVFYSE